MPMASRRVQSRAHNPVGGSPTGEKRLKPCSLGGIMERKQDGEASDRLFHRGMMQRFRPQRAVNADVASLHATPVAETIYHARRQQGPAEMGLIRRFSSAGYQRWHEVKGYVSTGEALGIRRRNLVEEAAPNREWEVGP